MTQRNGIANAVVLYALMAIVIAACQTSSPPQNTSEAIGAAYASLTTVAHDVATASTSGLISAEQTADLKKQLQAAKNNIDRATDLYAAGNSAMVSDRLQATHLILSMIIKTLQDQKAGKHPTSTGSAT